VENELPSMDTTLYKTIRVVKYAAKPILNSLLKNNKGSPNLHILLNNEEILLRETLSLP
jgi:hypothetical protein